MKTVDFSETIAACDLKVGRCRQLINVSIKGQGHFFSIYFPGFVCLVLYLAKISDERLQDHWSSGYGELTKMIFNYHQIPTLTVFWYYLSCIIRKPVFMVTYKVRDKQSSVKPDL